MTTQGQPIGVAPEAEKARDIATLEQEIRRRHVERLRQAGGRAPVRARLRALAAPARNVLILAGAITFGMAVTYLALRPLVHRSNYEARLDAVNDHVHRNHASILDMVEIMIDRHNAKTASQDELWSGAARIHGAAIARVAENQADILGAILAIHGDDVPIDLFASISREGESMSAMFSALDESLASLEERLGQ